MRENLAKIISSIFDPRITIPLFFLILVFKTGLTVNQLKINLLLVVIVDFILPTGIFLFFLKNRWVGDLDITRRKERPGFFLILCILAFLASSLFYFFGGKTIFNLHLIFLIGFFLATVITFFWKISIHMLTDTMIFISLTLIFPQTRLLLFLLPIIAWSRYVRHKHTLLQLLGGFGLGILVVVLGTGGYGL